jgi:hypothetical protein
MARVNIEDRFFGEPRLAKLQHLMGCSRFEAIGLLVTLWHGSQERLTVIATPQQISDWCEVFDPDQATKLIDVLVSCEYITKVRGGYEIKGNRLQVESLEKYKNRGRKGGAATKNRWKKSSKCNEPESQDKVEGLKPSTSTATSLAQAGLKPSTSTAQFNSMQGNSMQGNTIQDKEEYTSTSVSLPAPPFNQFLTIWNDNRGCLPKVQALTSKRKSQIKSRLAEKEDLTYWTECVKKMAASNFCREGKWATFDWLIKNDTNHVKVMEGNYDDRGSSNGSAQGNAEPECSCSNGRYKIEEKYYRCPHCSYGRMLKNDNWPYITAELLDQYKSQQTLN